MGTETKRLEIINKLKSTFIKTEGVQELNKMRLVSAICMEYGVTKKKALEYIQVLIDGDFVYQDIHGLWLSKSQIPTEEPKDD